MRRDSTEYLIIPITGPSSATIATDVVTASFDAGITWWPCQQTTGGVRILVGPGSSVGALPLGVVNVLVKITDSPEIPVLAAGGVVIE